MAIEQNRNGNQHYYLGPETEIVRDRKGHNSLKLFLVCAGIPVISTHSQLDTSKWLSRHSQV